MRYRKLRIAFSAVCGVVCLLLIVLWLRSYYRLDRLWHVDKNLCLTMIGSTTGTVEFHHASQSRLAIAPQAWWHSSDPAPKDVSDFWASADKNGFYFRFPIWLPTVIFATLAPLPWIRRFSLGTMLIATTVIAVVLGVLAYIYEK
jgi:hypothetical protein